jgi:hypothetical protein
VEVAAAMVDLDAIGATTLAAGEAIVAATAAPVCALAARLLHCLSSSRLLDGPDREELRCLRGFKVRPDQFQAERDGECATDGLADKRNHNAQNDEFAVIDTRMRPLTCPLSGRTGGAALSAQPATEPRTASGQRGWPLGASSVMQ